MKLNLLLQKIVAKVPKNLFAWFFFILFLIAAYGDHSTTDKLERVCGLISADDVEICIDGKCNILAEVHAKVKHQRTMKDEVNNICQSYKYDDLDYDR